MEKYNYKVGNKCSDQRQITKDLIRKFSEITGDNNPIHSDEEYAKTTMFGGLIAPGILVAGLISGVLGDKFPGPGTIYVSQNLKFLKPVKVNDCITAEVEIIDINTEKDRLILKTRCYNQKGIDVIVGDAVVIPPK